MRPRAAVEALLVVVPARDEERRLPACLAALAEAVDAVVAPDGPLPRPAVDVVVVLDRCTDASARVVAGDRRVRGLRSLAGCAGGARRLGVGDALVRARERGADLARTWVSSTDADSRVPRDWLVHQLALAAEGADLVLGTVLPDDAVDERELPVRLRAAWAAGYAAVEGHGHVHAANLGVRASTYVAAGGFPPVAAHEDVALVAAARAVRARVVSTAGAPVLTSARLAGRAPHGFAAHLASLAPAPGLTTR